MLFDVVIHDGAFGVLAATMSTVSDQSPHPYLFLALTLTPYVVPPTMDVPVEN